MLMHRPRSKPSRGRPCKPLIPESFLPKVKALRSEGYTVVDICKTFGFKRRALEKFFDNHGLYRGRLTIDVNEVRKLANSMTQRQLAVMFGTCQTNISKILRKGVK